MKPRISRIIALWDNAYGELRCASQNPHANSRATPTRIGAKVPADALGEGSPLIMGIGYFIVTKESLGLLPGISDSTERESHQKEYKASSEGKQSHIVKRLNLTPSCLSLFEDILILEMIGE